MAPRRAPAEHRRDLILVEPAQRDHVDLDPEPGRRGGLDSAKHLRKVAAPSDVAESIRVAAVEADIDPADIRYSASIGRDAPS